MTAATPAPRAVQLSVPRALLVSSAPLVFAAPALFYFGVFEATLEFLLFALFIACPLAVAIYLIARTGSIDLVNRHYGKLLVFYVVGSAVQIYLLGFRATYFLAFKAGEIPNIEGSEFKIPILAGLLAWAKFILIVTSAENKRLNYVAYVAVVFFEAIANFKRSALIFLFIPLLLRLFLTSRSGWPFYAMIGVVVVLFGLIGELREAGEDVFANLEPASSNFVLNWLFTYTSINYHVAYQKFLAAAPFDTCFILRPLTGSPQCEADFALFGFNATTYVGNFVESGIGGMFLLQLVMILFAVLVRSLSPVSRGLYLYLLTLYLLNLFGAYILERNEFMLAVGWFAFELVRRGWAGRASRTGSPAPPLALQPRSG